MQEVTQYAGSLEEGIDLIRDSDRAVPWLYLIADGEQPDAAVLETVASSVLPPQDNLQNYLSRLLTGLLEIFFPFLDQDQGGNLPQAIPDGQGRGTAEGEEVAEEMTRLSSDASCPELERGVMIRESDYADPEWLDGLKWAYQPEDDSGLAYGFFPRQLEAYPDLVAMTNHYIIPLMAATYPSLHSGGSSLWRYETMLGLLDNSYGDIDQASAMWIIDFLNPARCAYYGTDTTQSIKGHHVLMDNQDLEMWSLHGCYNTSWVHVDLPEIISGKLTLNRPPLAEAGPDLEAMAGQPLVLEGASGDDPDGDDLFCHWDFGDGGGADTASPTYTYNIPGEYEAVLTVSDAMGATASDSCTVTVSEDGRSRLQRLVEIFLSFLRRR